MKNDKNYIWDDYNLDDDKEETFDKFKDVTIDFEEIEQEPQDDENKEKKKINFKKLFIIATIIFLIILFFIPVFNINNVNVSSANFVTKDEVLEDTGIVEGEKYSLFNLLTFKFVLDNNSIIDYSTNYSFTSKDLIFEVNELKPLAISGEYMYYLDADEIDKTKDFKYEAPTLVNMDSSVEQEIIKELSTLDYDIIKDIDEIQLNANEINTELLLMRMNDGNLVEININQISEKMPYYDQIKEIIQSEGSGPGIIHLNIGDYYEPF